MIDITFAFEDLEKLLLVFARMSMFIATAPFFSMQGVPARFKIGFSFFLSILLFQVLPLPAVVYETVIDYGVIVVKEAAVGAIIGFSADICSAIVTFAGQVIVMDIGLSMANMFDPTMNESVSLTGAMYRYFVLLLLMITGMHHYIIRAIADSYQLIPLNGAVFNFGYLYQGVLQFLGDYFIIGFRICLPVFMCSLLLNIVLGILAKSAPQMNMFAVGMQLKVLLGLIVLFLIASLLPDIANFISGEIKKMIVFVIEGMRSV